MLMKMRSKMQNEKGFTLVELMVVVVILGILVAIAVPIYNNITTKAAKNACDANLRSIQGVLEVFKADSNDGKYPADDGFLSDKKYFKEEPKCFDESYVYTPSTDLLTYNIECPDPSLHNTEKDDDEG